MDYINLYNGIVSAGSFDGKLVDDANKIITTVRTTGEEKAQNIAIRCEAGYQTEGATTLTLTGDSKDAWAFEYNEVKGEYGAPLTISDTIEDKNIIVKLYSKALTSEEGYCLDTTVKINLNTAVIEV